MSSTELRELLLKLKKHPNVHTLGFYPRDIILNGEATFTRDGHIEVRKKGSKKVYKIETYFMHHDIDDADAREAIRQLKDLLLIVKWEEGKLRARDIVSCRNVEIRKYLLARFGFDNFVHEMKGKVLDRDGDQELIMVPWRRDEEPITMVKVKDSTTDDIYLLRVPPNMKTCREAVAWTFGMTAEEYVLEKET